MTLKPIVCGLFLWLGLTAAAAGPVGEEEGCAIIAALAEKGFYDGPQDCVVGPEARRAVVAFQRRNGLVPDGVVGEDTYCKLMGYCRGGRRVGRGEREPYDDVAGERQSSGECKDDPIEASGAARPTQKWAMKVATDNWRRDARARYGEEWANFASAKVVESKCFTSSVGGGIGPEMQRCRIKAYACQS